MKKIGRKHDNNGQWIQYEHCTFLLERLAKWQATANYIYPPPLAAAWIKPFFSYTRVGQGWLTVVFLPHSLEKKKKGFEWFDNAGSQVVISAARNCWFKLFWGAKSFFLRSDIGLITKNEQLWIGYNMCAPVRFMSTLILIARAKNNTNDTSV